LAFDSRVSVQAETTSTTTTTGQWFTSTNLTGTPGRGIDLTLNMLFAATSAALGTANAIIQASPDGSTDIVTVGQFKQQVSDATATAIATGIGYENTITVTSMRRGYLRAVLQLSGASPGYTAVWSVKEGSSNAA